MVTFSNGDSFNLLWYALNLLFSNFNTFCMLICWNSGLSAQRISLSSMVDLVDLVFHWMILRSQLQNSQSKEEKELTYRLRALRFISQLLCFLSISHFSHSKVAVLWQWFCSNCGLVDGKILQCNATISWDLVVGGWDLEYSAEFVPIKEGSYTIAVEKPRKIASSEEAIHNSFTAREAGKLVLSVDNTHSKRKKVAAYRYTVRRSLPSNWESCLEY